MTAQELDLFLNVVAALCAAMVFVNLLLVKRRGVSAYFLAVAFLFMGATILLYARQGTSPLVIGGGSLVVLLLIVDFVLRAPNQQTRRRR
jgi:hypothetical protein